MSRYSTLLSFLSAVDSDFITPISEKCNIAQYAQKLDEYAYICGEYSDEEMIGLVAGYTNKTENHIAYISCVAVLKEHRGKGIATRLVMEFLNKSKSCNLKGVHCYTENESAYKMYKKIGFKDYEDVRSQRANSKQLIYWF